MLCHRGSQHRGIVFGIDDPLIISVFFKKARCHVVIFKTAAALPVHSFGYAALVCSVADFLHTRDNVCMAMFT